MTPLRVIVADDEPLALERLLQLLAKIEGVEVVGSAVTGEDAITAICNLGPELVILDVEMPRTDGLDVVEILARDHSRDLTAIPLIAFATAYPQFAIQAFDTGALDFLCKPVRLSRLQTTIDRARRALESRDAAQRLRDLHSNLAGIRDATNSTKQHIFWIRNRAETVRVQSGDIEWIAAEGQYLRLHLTDRSFLLRSSIAAVAEQLSDEGFVRVHRSTVVNRRRVAKLKSSRTQTRLVLDSGVEVNVGRKYRDAIREILTGQGAD